MNTPVFDFYKILGLPKDASSEDVRRAYKQKVLETHPDKLPPDSTEEEKEAAHEQFSRVHEASEILGDPDRRREYDIHYRELPAPSIRSVSSPKSPSVSMSRSNSNATVRSTGPANLARTSSMVSSASAKSASKSHTDSPSSLSRTNSMTSARSAATSATSLSRTSSVASKPQSVARANTILSFHSADGPPSPVSRANSSASAREAQGTPSRSNSSATVRGAPVSVFRKDSISSDHQSSESVVSNSTPTNGPQPLSRSNSTVAAAAAAAAPPPASVSRSNSIRTVTAISLHETSSIVRSNSRATARSSVSARSKAMSNYANRISMATVATAFRDLPAPPYSHPDEYEALVDAMVQELYRLNPEWEERKQQLQQIKAQREAGNKVDFHAWRALWAP
ncbi:hypothetical protein BJV78DRAFT_586936 [Lactifluus subvellereus]|nr:hypothetical protein BJV78DRAFT_586936 [Lactifluus subvellereus]